MKNKPSDLVCSNENCTTTLEDVEYMYKDLNEEDEDIVIDEPREINGFTVWYCCRFCAYEDLEID